MLIKSTYVVYKQGNPYCETPKLSAKGINKDMNVWGMKERRRVDPDREGGNVWGILGEVHTSERSRKQNELMTQLMREREKERTKERECTGTTGGYFKYEETQEAVHKERIGNSVRKEVKHGGPYEGTMRKFMRELTMEHTREARFMARGKSPKHKKIMERIKGIEELQGNVGGI